jgi:glyoxylase-like metal-dependent hydrolase (beta-lactamase superfamily II)
VSAPTDDERRLARRRRRAREALLAALQAREQAHVLDRDWHEADDALGRALEGADVLEEADRANLLRRREELVDALTKDHDALLAYGARHGLGGVFRFTTARGVDIYRVPAETFPGHVNYVYVFEVEGQRVLWDCGSGLFDSRAQLLAGLDVVERAFGASFAPDRFDVLLISHGHIDHFGDAVWFQQASGAQLWVHELDARVLERHRERVVLTSQDMRVWLRRAGVEPDEVQRLIEMHLRNKDRFDSDAVEVDRRLRHGDRVFSERGRVIHTPGHCPGHVCLLLDDHLFVADQVLDPISPHISPQALHPHNGLERYLEGLFRLRAIDGVGRVLPAHYDEIDDLGARIDEIIAEHVEKLRKVRDACDRPRTVAEVAAVLYGDQREYAVLLALLEAGAHVEYLHQVGSLKVHDVDSLVLDEVGPFRYLATEVFAAPMTGSRGG